MGLSCGMSMVKYGLFIFNLVCAVSKRFVRKTETFRQTILSHLSRDLNVSWHGKNPLEPILEAITQL